MGQPILKYESGQTAKAFEALTDQGDQINFAASFSPVSDAAGSEPVFGIYGLLTGGAITPEGVTNNEVSVAALTAFMPAATGADADGVVSVSGADVAITRPATAVAKVNSITIDNTGSLAVVAGTDSADANFSETRGAAGGPPYIPTDSIEIGQVRVTSDTAALIVEGEIYTVPGIHVESADYPTVELDYATGIVTASEALATIHTGDVPRLVYLKGATPLFATLGRVSDWVPAEVSHSISSVDTYDGPVGSSSASLAQATFNVVFKDGLSDAILALKGQRLWFEFRQDRDKSYPKQLTLGTFAVSRSFPAGGGNVSASCTITPDAESLDILSA